MAVIQGGSSADLAGVNANKQLLVSDSTRNRSGVYIATSGLLTMLAAAHAATAGFVWLLNPLTSTKLVAVRRVEVDSMGIAAAAAITRITAERISFTGTPTGAAIASGKVDSNYVAPSALFTAANTGLTITAGATLYGWMAMAVITAAGVAEPVLGEWEPAESAMPILRPGEGLVLRQADAGAATDPRRAVVNLAWEEW